MYIILIIIILFKEQQKQCLRIQKYLLKINLQYIWNYIRELKIISFDQNS